MSTIASKQQDMYRGKMETDRPGAGPSAYQETVGVLNRWTGFVFQTTLKCGLVTHTPNGRLITIGRFTTLARITEKLERKTFNDTSQSIRCDKAIKITQGRHWLLRDNVDGESNTGMSIICR